VRALLVFCVAFVFAEDALVRVTPPSSMESPNAGCTWSAADGTLFDLSRLKLSGTEDYTGDDQYLKYRMNICAPVNQGGNCGASSICSFWKDDGTYHQQYGEWNGAPSPQWALIEPGRAAGGIVITFANGKSTCMGKIETAYLNLKCDPGQPSLKTFAVSENFGACTLTITYTNSVSCPVSADSLGGGGLSGGSVFLILVLVVAVVYTAGGCIYNRRKNGTVGMAESCPNIGFWRAIPELTMAGCRFTWSKITGKPVGYQPT